jgi:tRNA (cmo5U34)-methyltransferase
MDLNRAWQFDASVANEFDAHARQNIPGYEDVVDVSLAIAKACCAPGDRIAEIGCATGYTLGRLEHAGFRNLVGVDSSQAMLDHCRLRHSTLVCSSEFPQQLGPFKLVLLNWTLHFVAPAERGAYLSELVASLADDGILLLTEKTRQSPLVEALYHGFKKSRGMSEADVAAKKRSITGVLETLPHTWYLHTLEDLELDAEIVWAQYGFVTYLARRAPDSALDKIATLPAYGF